MFITPQDVQKTLEDLNKAISVTPVTGINLVREDLQSEMAIAAPVDTPVRNRLARIPGNGKAHAWYRLTGTSTANGTFLGTDPSNAFFTKGGLPTSADPAYSYVAAPYVNIGDLATVSFMDQAEGASYIDLRKHQIKIKMLNTALCEEWAIINGNSTTNPLAFDGFDVQITDTVDYATFTPVNATYKLLEFVTESCRQIAYAGGQPRMLVMSYAMKSKLTNQILAQFYGLRQTNGTNLGEGISGGVNIGEWDFGWGKVELVPSRYLLADSYGEKMFLIDHQSIDTVNNGNCVQMVDLTPIGAVDLALLQTAWRTIVYETTVLMISVPSFQRKLINIS